MIEVIHVIDKDTLNTRSSNKTSSSQAKIPRTIMTRTAIIEIVGSIIKQSTSINKIKITTNLVNPSVTEGMVRVRTLTIGTRAAQVMRVDVASKRSRCIAPSSTTLGSNKTIKTS